LLFDRNQPAIPDGIANSIFVGHGLEYLAERLLIAPVRRGCDAEHLEVRVLAEVGDYFSVCASRGVVRLIDYQQAEFVGVKAAMATLPAHCLHRSDDDVRP